MSQRPLEINPKAKSGDWKAKLKTTGLSDLNVVEVTIQPGRTRGWHSHPEPSFVAVESGTATFYEADDPCVRRAYFRPGRSSSNQRAACTSSGTKAASPIVNVVVQLIPTGAPRLVSKPSPGNCPSGLGRSRREAEGGQSPRSDSSLWTLPPDLAANGLLRKRAQTRFRGHLAHASANHLKPPYEHWHCAKQAEAHGNGRNRPYQLCKPEGRGFESRTLHPKKLPICRTFLCRRFQCGQRRCERGASGPSITVRRRV
jgi:hypothetical protein